MQYNGKDMPAHGVAQELWALPIGMRVVVGDWPYTVVGKQHLAYTLNGADPVDVHVLDIRPDAEQGMSALAVSGSEGDCRIWDAALIGGYGPLTTAASVGMLKNAQRGTMQDHGSTGQTRWYPQFVYGTLARDRVVIGYCNDGSAEEWSVRPLTQPIEVRKTNASASDAHPLVRTEECGHA